MLRVAKRSFSNEDVLEVMDEVFMDLTGMASSCIVSCASIHLRPVIPKSSYPITEFRA